jgi:YVTN family beta-propeller protein
MKKVSRLILMAGLLIGLIACSSKDQEEPNDALPAEEPSAVSVEPAYVTFRDGNALGAYPEEKSWDGGEKMLYDALTPDGQLLVATSPSTNQLYIYEAKTSQEVAVVPVGELPKGVKITPDGKEAWVSNEGEDSISIVDLASFQVVETIKTEDMPHNLRFTADGKTAYVTLQGGAGLGVVDTSSRQVTQIIPITEMPAAHNLDLSADEKTAYVRNAGQNVAIIDLSSGEVKKILEVGSGHGGIDVMPDGRYAFTGAIADKVVSVIDLEKMEVIKKIEVGSGPHGVRASADGAVVYVSVTGDNQVAVIDTETLEVTKRYDAGEFPFWVAVQNNP